MLSHTQESFQALPRPLTRTAIYRGKPVSVRGFVNTAADFGNNMALNTVFWDKKAERGKQTLQ